MALNSFLKNLSDRVAHFSDWKFKFQKTRVIGSLRPIDQALENFVSSPFLHKLNRGEIFVQERGSMDSGRTPYCLMYEEGLFLNHIVKHWKFDISRLSKYELEDYECAVKKLQKWEEVRLFMTEVRWFVTEIREVTSMRRNAHSEAEAYEMGYPEFEEEINEKYQKLLKQLEPFPEWKEKVSHELDRSIFESMFMYRNPEEEPETSPFVEIDKQRFFK